MSEEAMKAPDTLEEALSIHASYVAEVNAKAAVIAAAMAADKARIVELEGEKDRLMIAAAATVKSSMDEYKRGHDDGERKGLTHGLEQAVRIARAAQYSTSPATDTMRNIERLIDGLSIVKDASHAG